MLSLEIQDSIGMFSVSSLEKRTVIRSDPDFDRLEIQMQFRLTYEGILLASSKEDTRAEHKHDIRRKFHPQLKRLWEVSLLRNSRERHHCPFPGAIISVDPGQKWPGPSRAEKLAVRFFRNNYHFVPLVTEDLSVYCGIDILFLRPDVPGTVIRSGDIDNRLKTLFDALRMPKEAQEIPSDRKFPGKDEEPFYCLLEEDKFISKITVETDVLLEPSGKDWDQNDARLVITVTLRPYEVNWTNIDLV